MDGKLQISWGDGWVALEKPRGLKTMGKRVFQLFFGVLMIIFTCGMASASMMGDNISVDILAKGPFSANCVVSDGIEFSTYEVQDGSGQLWRTTANISDDSIEINFYESTKADNSGRLIASKGYDIINFHFYDIDWVGSPAKVIKDISLSSYTSTLDSNNNEGPMINSLAFGHNTIDIKFYGVRDTDVYKFKVDFTPTPIPAAIWIFGSGIAGLAGLRRRKKNRI